MILFFNVKCKSVENVKKFKAWLEGRPVKSSPHCSISGKNSNSLKHGLGCENISFSIFPKKSPKPVIKQINIKVLNFLIFKKYNPIRITRNPENNLPDNT